MNWYTCISDIGDEDCPMCEAAYKYSYVCAFSIIDLSKYTNKQGKKVTARKKLLITKSTARNKVLKQKERREGDLTGCVYEVTRFTEKECSTGEDFEFLKRATLDEIKELCPTGENADEFVTPYDYMDIFAPKTANELRAIIGAAPPVGSSDGPGMPAAEGTKSKTTHAPSGEGQAKSLKDLL